MTDYMTNREHEFREKQRILAELRQEREQRSLMTVALGLSLLINVILLLVLESQ